MRPDVHARGVEPDEERLPLFDIVGDELLFGREDLLVDRRHTRLRERAGVFDFCPPLPSLQVCSTPRGPYFVLNAGSFG